MSAADAVLDAALSYAAREWRVLPIWAARPDGTCACGAAGCTSPGKHPLGALVPHGVQDATADPELIRVWWARHPDANVAIATGDASGVDVLDIDGDEGRASLQALEKQHGELPKTPECLTGGGGRHVFFRHREGMKNAVRFAPGLDVRTTGGYVVAAPSRHASGRVYTWDCTLDPADVPPAAWPDWLAALVSAPGGRQRSHGPAPAAGDEISEHFRNTTLASLAGSMRRRGHSDKEILAALLCTNAERCRPPLTEAEVEKIVQSVASYATHPELLTAPTTDLGNRDRLVACHGSDVHYHGALGWIAWTGTHWAIGADHIVVELAARTVRALYAELAKETDDHRRQALAKHAVASESASRIRAMVELARTHPAIRVEPEALDADPWLLGVQNGVIDLRTGQLRPHRREDLITRTIPIEYDPNARAPRWEAFLAEIQPDREMRAFLHRFTGYVLTGDTGEQIFVILHGPGSNGKSVLVNILLALLACYGQTTPFTTFLQRRPDAPTNDLADLRGARLAVSSEPDEGARLSESVVKRITGQDPITARHHYQEFQTFIPVCKVVLVGNHKPRIRGGDAAIWRRVLLVPFNVKIPKERRDRDLPRKLKDELPGILAWAVQGCLTWQREGLRPPEAIIAATDLYRREEDHFGRFLEDVCEFGVGLSVTASALRATYLAWCEREGEEPLGTRTVARSLNDRGITAAKSGSTRSWKGLGIAGDARHDAAGASPPPPAPAPQSEGASGPTHEEKEEFEFQGEPWERWSS